jgi:hypothetical protein
MGDATTGGVCPDGEGMREIDGSKLVFDLAHVGSGAPHRSPMASAELGGMLAFIPLLGLIQGMSVSLGT